MHFLPPELERYTELFSSPEPEYLRELAEETRAESDMAIMLSGHVQGRLLALLSKLVAPRLVLDIGTFTGYSALCLAEGLVPDGIVHTIDIRTPLASFVERHIRKAGMHERIHQHYAPALDVIPRLEGTFDIVFIDADKQNYSNYFDSVIDRVRPGGSIIADNVLWSGKVMGDANIFDPETRGLSEYVQKLKRDDRVENVLLPLRDGLLISRRK